MSRAKSLPKHLLPTLADEAKMTCSRGGQRGSAGSTGKGGVIAGGQMESSSSQGWTRLGPVQRSDPSTRT